MKVPPFLKKGDCVGILSPAGIVKEEYILNAKKLLENEGFWVQTGKHTLSKHGYFAGTDQQRAKDMQKMLDDKNIKAIFCSRGGYGTIRIIPFLNTEKFLLHPKWIIGFSDITALHIFINHNTKICTIHGPVTTKFKPFGQVDEDINNTLAILRGNLPEYQLTGNALNQQGECSAPVTGGNLSVIYSLQGTPYEINTKGKILLLEDIDESIYHIDRMMQNLKLSGKLKDIKGLIIGNFTAIKDTQPAFGQHTFELIKSYITNKSIPIAVNIPCGHENQNLPIIFGKKITLTVTKKESIIKL